MCACSSDNRSGPVAVPYQGCEDHYGDGDDGWCYVQGGTSCLSATASRAYQGAAWIYCGQGARSALEHTYSPLHTTPKLHAGGSSLPVNVFRQWFFLFQIRSQNKYSLKYTATTSAGGMDALLAREIDFSSSDSALSDKHLKHENGGDLVNLPALGAAVVCESLIQCSY